MNTRQKERFYNRSLGGTMKVRKTLSISSTLKRDTVNKEHSENDFISTDKEILFECENFYKNFYTSKIDTNKNRKCFLPTPQKKTETIEP